jgi:hypothetical protein
MNDGNELSSVPACAQCFDLSPEKGIVHCELPAGHNARWHRSESDGFEWSGRILWLLPPGMIHAA